MSTFAQTFRRVVRRSAATTQPDEAAAAEPSVVRQPLPSDAAPVEIAPNDPLVAYFQSAPGAIDIDSLELESPALAELREAGVKLAVPLVSQGELIGLLNLGPRLSDQAYSSDDRRLLDSLASQAAPAVRVGQLVREQEAEVRARERLEQELEVARLIQHNLLPKELPDLPGWNVAAFYRPARAVGGDFYDFIELPEGRLGIVCGDVTDKGVPAAMVMAATRTVLRASAQELESPAAVLGRVNDLLCPDIPAKMFVTCLYGVLEPATGTFRYANAGHNLPYVRTDAGVVELRATGMPLGLLSGMSYEEKVAALGPGEIMLLHSDGIAEAHNTEREMFGFPRLTGLVRGGAGGTALIDLVLSELDRFTGPGWEQEDDITLVTLERSAGARIVGLAADGTRALAEFAVSSDPGNERDVMTRVAAAVEGLGLSPARLERLKTAVSEATMNAIEHGNESRHELQVSVRVLASDAELRVQITDEGGERPIPAAEAPDLEAKLAGLQKPRGWGLFLIQNMVDSMEVSVEGSHHTVELIVHLKGGGNASEPL